jgi:hypothetical protein
MDLVFSVWPDLSSDVAEFLSAMLAPANERASCESLLKLIDRAWSQGTGGSSRFFFTLRVSSQSYSLLGAESEVQSKPSSVKVPFLGSNRARSQGRSGDKTFPLTNATSGVLASGVDIDVKAIATPSLHSPAKLPYQVPLRATMPTENEKNPNASSANNANPNSTIPSPHSPNLPYSGNVPTENQNSYRPTQVKAYRRPLVAGRGRGMNVPNPNHHTFIVPNPNQPRVFVQNPNLPILMPSQGSTTSNAQNRTNG